MDDLPTVDIPNVEILKVGRWNGRNYTVEDLEHMVEAFDDLRGVYQPFGKFGHNDEQPLLKLDGQPAVGWVSALRRVGAKLIADFEKVPRKYAKLIKAEAYKNRSSEIWFDIKINGTKYPAVLKAVAWLGADPPAVAGMLDRVAMFSDASEHPVSVVTLTAEDLAMNDCPDCPADCEECGPDCACHASSSNNSEEGVAENAADEGGEGEGEPPPSGDDEVDPVEMTRAQLRSLTNKISKMGAKSKGISELRAVLSDASSRLDKIRLVHNSQEDPEEGETLQDSEIREILELEEGADIKQALLSMKAGSVALSDYQTLSDQVTELNARMLDRDATEVVELALKDGKLAPTQREWALGYFKKDPEAFKTFVENAPKVVNLTEVGSADGGKPDPVDLPKSANEIADVMGVDPERLTMSASEWQAKRETANV